MLDIDSEIEEKLARIESMVGNTPMLKLRFEVDDKPVHVFAKHEALKFLRKH